MPFIYALILSFGIMLGYMVSIITVGKQNPLSHKYNKIDDIVNYITLKYVDTINRSQLVDKTIDKMLSTLDPHSVYLPASEVSEANESLEGNFEGIGIEFYIVQDTINVVAAIPGGPSDLLGLKAGDKIIKIEDSTVAGIKIKETDVKHRLRGPKGTTVKVSILRGGAKKLLDFNINRDKIPLYSIDAAYMVSNNIGYVRITNFSATTHEEFVEKVTALKKEGMTKLIIDLRGNPGGYLLAATSIADELIAGNKLLLFTKGKAYERQDYMSSKPGIFEDGGVAVLINEGSASASEILSGAIQDLDRGTIIGRRSFGKGLVQEQYELRDGSALRLTIARYYTPSGRCIQKPYDKGLDEYNMDRYERYMRGEFLHEDSINSLDTIVYKTSKGRRVFGGGGIRPDIFVPLDTAGETEYYFATLTYLPEFVLRYLSDHADLRTRYKTMQEFKSGFAVTDEILNQFFKFAETAGLKRNDEKARKSDAKLRLTIKAYFAKQMWRMEGYYYIVNEGDKVLTKAVEKLNQPNAP